MSGININISTNQYAYCCYNTLTIKLEKAFEVQPAIQGSVGAECILGIVHDEGGGVVSNNILTKSSPRHGGSVGAECILGIVHNEEGGVVSNKTETRPFSFVCWWNFLP